MKPARAALCAFVAAALGAARLAAADAELTRLLADSDPFATAPSEMRVELVFSSPRGEARVPVEIWRKGEGLALVRFLAPRDLGKYVVRRDGDFYFLSPRAAEPVRLAPALAPAGGAALDALLAVRPSRDYDVVTTSEHSGQVTFDLAARAGTPGAPRLRWVVSRATRRPLRVEFRDAADAVERLVEFKAWRAGRRLEPAAIVAKEIGRGSPPLEVEFVAIEERAVPAALFDLKDGSARAALPPPQRPPEAL